MCPHIFHRDKSDLHMYIKNLDKEDRHNSDTDSEMARSMSHIEYCIASIEL